jgi:hypothetical protein
MLGRAAVTDASATRDPTLKPRREAKGIDIRLYNPPMGLLPVDLECDLLVR